MPATATRVTPRMFRRLQQDEMLPEFRAVRRNPKAFAKRPVVRQVLRACKHAAGGIEPIPADSYTLWHEYGRNGVRRNYDALYFRRRTGLAVASVLALLHRDRHWIDLVHDYAWSICGESNWVVPEHMGSDPIDLFSSETAFQLAETVYLLGDLLDDEVVRRIGDEVEQRILAPYLRKAYGWFNGHNNWTGVCESSVGAAYLYLEKDPKRLARAINRVLAGLERFRRRAFLEDGGSSEGVGYWQYGLINTVAFSEMLRLRTRGKVDFLAHEKVKKIAGYPYASLVAPHTYYSCSDSHGSARFAAGFAARLAERTGSPELAAFLNRDSLSVGVNRFAHMVRTMLWWDGKSRGRPTIADYLLPDTGVARLVDRRHKLVLMAKAGNNQENHNHNDVGSFELYVDGEALLCDPGCGLYDGSYFGPKRYDNPMCGSHGHGVPVIGGKRQAFGAKHRGEVAAFEPGGRVKTCTIEFARAYPAKNLKRLDRALRLDTRDGTLEIEDTFAFSGRPASVEEALVTWGRVSVRGRRAMVRNNGRQVRLEIVEPAGATFRVEELPVMVARSTEPRTLRRLACVLPKGATSFTLAVRPGAQ